MRRNNSVKNNTGTRCPYCLSLFFFLLLIIFSPLVTAAAEPENNAALVEYLAQEKTHITIDINELKQHALPKNASQFKSKMQYISTILTLTRAKIESLEGFYDNQMKQQMLLNQKLNQVKQLPLANAEETYQERVGKIETFLTINKKSIELINENLTLARQYEFNLNDEVRELETWNANFQLEQKIIEFTRRKKDLSQELNALFKKNVTIKNQKNLEQTSSSQIKYEASILVNNQHIALINHQLNTLNLQKRVVRANILLLKSPDTKTLQGVSDIYINSIDYYSEIESSLQQMLVFLNNEATLGLDADLNNSIKQLQVVLKKQLKQVEFQKQSLLKDLAGYQLQLKKLISSRQSLAEYNMNSLPLIMSKLVTIPGLLYKYTKTLTLKVYDNFLWLDVIPTTILWFVMATILCVFYILNRLLRRISLYSERSNLSRYLYYGALILVQRNIPYLCVFTIIWSILYFTNISFSNYQLLINLITVWFIFRIHILIARLVLLERISDSSGKDVKLYYRLKWLLLFGGWTTALMTMSHLLPLSLLLQDIFNRLFMLFILAVSLVTWKSKDVIFYLLSPLLANKKRYLKNAISLLVILIPITLFTTAVIGLLGYIHLAWTMSRYQAYIVMVLVGYVLARGLLFDALALFSEWMVSSLRNGWLWIEVFLKPLDNILRIIILLLSVAILFQLFGWHSDSLVIISLEQLSHYSIINLTGIHITVASTVAFFIILAIFVWASKWTREFCFRWLYKNAKDAGIRNSLSVFTQYSVILAGGFITLRVLGIDFSGMSMILGGLAVGMGFGLRDFASNIVGGIMLLIERPVREGDLITIGEYEGQVSHIGIRSMRVSSWDNMEVLIPNAETFNKPFTNWTHQDGIVRTVIPIKVSRSDDPVMIQQLILDVLAIIPEIVADPPIQVLLKKIDEALIEFEVRYFINVLVDSRVEVRSKVLFAITAQFKAAGVRPPVEPITVEFKEGHGDFFNKKNSPED